MPNIQLTNNATLDLTVSSADRNATLNRYLQNPLTFLTPAGLVAAIDQNIGSLDAFGFPLQATATGDGRFSLEKTTLDVSAGVSATLGLLKDSDETDFLSSLSLPVDAAGGGIVSFALQGTVTVGDSATTGDFTFGISDATSVTLTGFHTAAADATLRDALTAAVAGLTIPGDIEDLRSLPDNAITSLDATGTLKFSASVAYSVAPLATTPISSLPAINIKATAGATLEATVTHTSDHTLTIAKLPGSIVHLSVSLTRTDDFETSLTVSAGVTAGVGGQDGLAFLLGKISPNAEEELASLQAVMPADQYQKVSGDIKSAINGALSSSFQASLKEALETSRSNNRVFLYEIDLGRLDAGSSRALQTALRGDFTALTLPGAQLAGVKLLDSTLTVTTQSTSTLGIHLLGIFNYGSTSAFIRKVRTGYTKDTHEIVLSDETIEVIDNNLSAEKLREVVVKGITLTLPASANTPEADTPISMLFFDREGSTSPSKLRQFANELAATGGSSDAASLLDTSLQSYGVCSIDLGLSLTPAQCRNLFVDGDGNAFDQAWFRDSAYEALATILENDPDQVSQGRRTLALAGGPFRDALAAKGDDQDIQEMLAEKGISPIAIPAARVDFVAFEWWSDAMSQYAKALAAGQPLEKPGEGVVKKSNLGFNEPWMILSTWNRLGGPALSSSFTHALSGKPKAIGAR